MGAGAPCSLKTELKRIFKACFRLEVTERMGIVGKAGDWAFKAFTAGLGVTTIYLAGTFSVNVYRGLAWHKAQPKIEYEDEQAS